LKATRVFETYWRFAVARQEIFMRRVRGEGPPWTDDPILAAHRFTNVYRASDRVSQFLIRHVLYDGSQQPDEVFFRALLFKLFNRVDTWQRLRLHLGPLEWATFDLERYASILDRALSDGERLYSAAYIMPSPPFGSSRKHRNHLALLKHMIESGAPDRIARAKSLRHVFEILRTYPSLGDFLAFQFTIDLNYSSMVNFDESEWVVAGPGARSGIDKCFVDRSGLDHSDVIRAVTDLAGRAFEILGLTFVSLWGRDLQLIDCQNLFCEVDKYSRVAHPEHQPQSGRVRIKQRFRLDPAPLPQWYPPKWKIEIPTDFAVADQTVGARQGELFAEH
jgi:hypothetical protein